MAKMHKRFDCLKSVVRHLPSDWQDWVSKQGTRVVDETALMQANLLWASPSSGRLVQILLGKVSILMGPCCFKTANLSPHSKNLEGIWQ